MPFPTFSIIVPTIGRIPALHNCLEAVKALNYPQEKLEILVVFDGCSPLELPALGSLTVRTLSQPQRGPAAARNYGASVAAGKYLAFTDDDCVLSPDWLLTLAAVFNRYPDTMAGGKTINSLADNPYASASQLLVDFLYERLNEQQNQAMFLTANNMAVSRQLFLACGGFDETFSLAAGEDREFCARWFNRGGTIHYAPEAVVHHAHDLTLSGFWKQHVNYGRGAYLFHKKRGIQEAKRSHFAGFSFYVNLLFFPLRQSQKSRAMGYFLLFLAMQTATTLGYLKERFSIFKPGFSHS